MTHEECLNVILSRARPKPAKKEGFFNYWIELNSSSFTVIAKPTKEAYFDRDENLICKYEIDSIRVVE